ncbi:MAG: alpha-aminoadipate/glutamate carrier protein LysW/ArgW [Nitrososphaeria archaeon]
MKTSCEVCGGEIDVPDDAIKGEIVSCPDCGSEYEVIEVKEGKPVLKPAEEIGEDWGE